MKTMKHPISRIAAVLMAAAILCAALCGCAPAADPTGVTVSIEISSAVEGADFDAVSGSVTLKDGGSVYDALKAFCEEQQLVIESSGSAASGGEYVSAIGGLGESSSTTAGWTYTVNGEMIMVSASECALKDGDSVAWSYVEW